VLPYSSPDGKRDMDWWWGDVDATVAYAKQVVPAICRQWGGDPQQVILTGYSRGAISCNHIGLHDDGIAKLWRAINPLSPALRSGPTAVSGASRQKQIPSSQVNCDGP
jgi:predicted esterase